MIGGRFGQNLNDATAIDDVQLEGGDTASAWSVAAHIKQTAANANGGGGSGAPLQPLPSSRCAYLDDNSIDTSLQMAKHRLKPVSNKRSSMTQTALPPTTEDTRNRDGGPMERLELLFSRMVGADAAMKATDPILSRLFREDHDNKLNGKPTGFVEVEIWQQETQETQEKQEKQEKQESASESGWARAFFLGPSASDDKKWVLMLEATGVRIERPASEICLVQLQGLLQGQRKSSILL
jgi:hypothetical protein